MSDAGFSFDTEIRDGMSAPARAEAQSLRGLQAEIRATEVEIRRLKLEQLDLKAAGFKKVAGLTGEDIARMRVPLSAMKEDFRDLKAQQKQDLSGLKAWQDLSLRALKAQEQATKGQTGFFEDLNKSLVGNIVLGDLAASAIRGIGGAIVDVVSGMARLTLDTAEYVVEVAEFRRNSEDAFTVLRGTVEEGKATFTAFEDLGRAVHMPTERAEGIAQRLMMQGEENMKTVKGVVEAVADLQRTGLQHGADTLEAIAERSLTLGAFKLPKFVKELGVSLPDLYAKLAARTHEGIEQVKKELKAGTFKDVEAGIQELTSAITGGKVGEVAQQKMGIGDAFTDIKNDVRGIFERIDTSPLADGVERARALFEDMFGDVDQGAVSFGDVVVNAVTEIEDRIVLFALRTKNEWWETKQSIANALDPTGLKSFDDDMKDLVEDVTALAKMAGQTLNFFRGLEDVWLALPKWIVKNMEEDEREDRGDFSGVGLDNPPAEAHARGGVVKRPADGEMFASVAPGETIVPAGAINIPDFAGSSMGGGGDTNVTVEAGAVQLHAPSGTMASKEELQQLSEQAVVDLVERIVAELGG